MKGKLRPSLHQRLRLLVRGPRFYVDGDKDNPQLRKMGLIEMTGAVSAEGLREWLITDAGRGALEAHEKGEP